MLSSISGKVQSVDQSLVTVTTGGFGVAILSAHPELYQSGQEVSVITYLHWNQEQGPTLYGFATELEKKVFLLIISCSGIGPKIGLAVLQQLTPQAFLQAVQEGNDKALSAVSGIGAKKAEQMVVQLRDKVAQLVQSGAVLEGQEFGGLEQWTNVTQVLKSLNYSQKEIQVTLAYLRKEYAGSEYTFDQLLRHGLSFLAKNV